ncbi:hypothetical protein KKD03_04180 [Patescibacteria group bacterium]|nr:hypothetical protein [Patescibacteria group bacterium]
MREKIFFLRSYKYDLLTSFFAILSYIISFKYAEDQQSILISLLIITIISFILIINLRLRDKDFFYIAFTKRKEKDDWIGRGYFEFRKTSNSYLITNSEPGFIFSKTLNWSDYSFEFDFKIIKDCLGAVVRAINLSDYVMLQIRDYGIRPHIRINGGWRPWEAKETGLEFDKKLSKDNWYKCKIACEKDLIDISIIRNSKTIFQRVWSIPHDRIAFPFPQKENELNPPSIHFPINLDYGTVGFRNAHKEKALIKNMLIEKL